MRQLGRRQNDDRSDRHAARAGQAPIPRTGHHRDEHQQWYPTSDGDAGASGHGQQFVGGKGHSDAQKTEEHHRRQPPDGGDEERNRDNRESLTFSHAHPWGE